MKVFKIVGCTVLVLMVSGCSFKAFPENIDKENKKEVVSVLNEDEQSGMSQKQSNTAEIKSDDQPTNDDSIVGIEEPVEKKKKPEKIETVPQAFQYSDNLKSDKIAVEKLAKAGIVKYLERKPGQAELTTGFGNPELFTDGYNRLSGDYLDQENIQLKGFSLTRKLTITKETDPVIAQDHAYSNITTLETESTDLKKSKTTQHQYQMYFVKADNAWKIDKIEKQ